MPSRIGTVALLLVCVSAGCTRVAVTKNPTDDDEGVRYFRPKPYLMIAPAPLPQGALKGATYVAISIQYLPDYDEEYSIRLQSGLGQGSLKVELKDGWNLTGVDLTTDQQLDELIGSFSGLLSAAAPLVRERTGYAAPCVVPVEHPVPLGLYEAVIAQGPDCRKGIFAWRYVGFAPFNSCAIQPHSDVMPVSCHDLWALVPGSGGLSFVRISELTCATMGCPAPEAGKTFLPPAPIEQ